MSLGVLAWQLGGAAALLFLTPLVLSISSLYLYLSWTYLNNDILGTTFVLAVFVCLFGRDFEKGGFFEGAILPGVLSGLAIACKYQLLVVLVPCLVMILLSPARRKLLRSVALLLTASGAFVMACPYVLLDFRGFLDGFGAQIGTYARHSAGGANLAMVMRPFRELQKDFGWLSPLLAVIGLGVVARADWRKSVALLGFAVALAVLMSSYPIYFPRNLLSLYPLYAALLGCCVVAAARTATAVAPGRSPRLAAALVVVLFTASIPWGRTIAAYDFSGESRNNAVRWMKRHAAPGATIFIPAELAMNVGSLRVQYDVIVAAMDEIAPGDASGGPLRYALVPTFRAHRSGNNVRAAALNARAESFAGRPLARFGSARISLGYPVPLASGDPIIEIRELGVTSQGPR